MTCCALERISPQTPDATHSASPHRRCGMSALRPMTTQRCLNLVPAAKPPSHPPRLRPALNAPRTRGRAARMPRSPANATKIIASVSSRTPAHIRRRNVGTNIFVHTVVQPTTATQTVWNDPRVGNNRPHNQILYIRCVITVCGAPSKFTNFLLMMDLNTKKRLLHQKCGQKRILERIYDFFAKLIKKS